MFDLNSSDFIKNWDYLYYYDKDLCTIFSAEKNLIKQSENYISDLRKSFNEKIENDAELNYKPKNYEEDSLQAQYYQHFYGDTEEILNRIAQSQRKSFVLSIFSIVEGQLKLIAYLIENNFDFNIKIKHLTGENYIHRYWLYITKVFEIDDSDVEKEYNLIKQQQYVRNKIAHRNSEIDESKLKFINESKGLISVKYGSDYLLEISDSNYINELIKNSELFFNKLSKAIDKRYGEIKNVG